MRQLTDDTRSEIPVLADDLDKLLIGPLASAISVDVNRQRFGDTNSVRELDKCTASETSSNKGLGYKQGISENFFLGTRRTKHTDPACGISSRTIDLREILAREGTSTVGTPATIGIDNDLATSKTSITLRTANNETSGGLNLRTIRYQMSISTLQSNRKWHIRDRWFGHPEGGQE